MNPAYIALLISFGSLAVAATSLGWNIYRDVIRKPRMRVSLMAGMVVSSPKSKEHPKRLIVSITNFGPGKTRASMLQLRKTSLWRKLFRKQIHAMLMHDYEDPLSGRLPAVLDVGDKIDLTFRTSDDIFIIKDDFTQIGISDPFSRVHWCSRADYKLAKASYLKYHKNTEQGAAANSHRPFSLNQ